MSMFLGPIHKWLYKQINIIEKREQKLIDKFIQEYGREVEEIIQPLRERYGAPKQDKPLEELVGDSQIHPWLENAIVSAQTREALVVKTLMDEYENKQLISQAYEEQAVYLAEQAKVKGPVSLEQAFKLLNEHLLERMPCDRLSQVKEKDQEIIWQHDAKLHQEFWLTAGVDLEIMHELYSTWIETFVKSLNPDISYERRIEQDYYEDVLSQ